MSSWDDLTTELDGWDEAGMIAEFWWRDDDAVEPTPALDQLLDLRKSLDVPLAIAAMIQMQAGACPRAQTGHTDARLLT